MKKKKWKKMKKWLAVCSLTLALLASSFQPVRAKANISLPDYSDIVEGAFAYFVCTTGDNYTGRVLLYVFDGARSGYEQDRIMFNFYKVTSSYIRNNVKYEWSNSTGTSYTAKWSPKVYILQTDTVSGNSAWVSGTTVYYPKPNGFPSNDTITDMYTVTNGDLPVSERARVEQMLVVKSDVDIYYINYFDEVPTYIKAYDSSIPETYGNATEEEWNAFASRTEDVIGYKYASCNGVDWSGWIWKEIRFNQNVYPYWANDENGIHVLKVYVPYEKTEYMIKDIGFYDNHGVYDYYKHTIEYTDEYVLQPYVWEEDYYVAPDESDKNYVVLELPYAVEMMDGESIGDKTPITVYFNLDAAKRQYRKDAGLDVTPTPNPSPSVSPIPEPTPLPETDDDIGIMNFVKEFEQLFNASGNMWRIVQYSFAWVPMEMVSPIKAVFSIILAIIIIRMAT